MNDHSSPSRVRYAVVAATALMAVLLYLDRYCISIAEVYIKQDLQLTDVQVGWMLSAFFWTYALGQVPSGWLTDRFGARITLTLYVLAWSLLTAGTGLAYGFALLLVLRLGFGLAQAGAYPTSAALLSRWVPLTARGTASSLVSLGGRAGGALAPVLTAMFIVAFVPTGDSSLLQPGDILQPAQFCGRLYPGPAPDAGQQQPAAERNAWVLDRLSPATQQMVQACATAELSDERLQEFQQLLADDLNQLIRGRAMAWQPFFDRAQLPREGQRLARRDLETLSQAELERLNRLLLETAFPVSLRRVYVAGWRPVMLLYGLLGIPVAALFWLVFRNRPVDHPRVNAAELACIRQGLPPEQAEGAGTAGGLPLVPLLTNRSMWLNCISQWATNVGWVFLVTWLPRYLDEVHQTPVEQRAVMMLIPVVVGFAGMLVGGRCTDWLVTRVGPRWGRALPIGLSRFVAMGAYLACLAHPSPWVAVALFSLVAFATDLGIGPLWAYVQDVGGRHVGSVLGWGNMWGNLGAAVTPPLLIWVVGEQRNWDAAFLTCAAAFLVAGVSGLGIDATSKIRPRS